MKKLIILLTLIFIPAAFGIVKGDRFFVIRDYSRGQNSHISEYQVSKGYGATVQNFRVNDEFGNASKRRTMLEYGDTGSATVNGLTRYYKADDTTFLVAATGTTLKRGNDSDGVFTTIKTGLSDGKFWQFVTYQDILIGANGSDNIQKWDGKTQTTANTDESRTVGLLTTDLGAPFAEQNTGANLDASSWYQYKMGYTDGTILTFSSSRSNPLLTGSTVRDVTLTDIPIGPAGTTARYLYRTLGDASQVAVEADTTFFLVATISDNTTTTVNDAMSDATAAGDAAPTFSTISAPGFDVQPPVGAIITLHRERLWASGVTALPSEIYWSDEFNPDYFAIIDLEKIREDDGDKVTFLKELLGILTVGKTNSIQKFYTDRSSELDWTTSDPFSFVGSPSPQSVVVSPIGIIYYGRFGIYSFNGQNSSLMSDAITPEMKDVNQSTVNECVGVYFNNEYQFSYQSDASGEGINNRVAVYDFIRDAYVIDTKKINSFAILSSGNDFGVLYSGSSDTDGKVFIHESSPSTIIVRKKSELDLGSFDDTRTIGEENDPELEIAWDVTIDEWAAELTAKGAGGTTIDDGIGTIDRPDKDGIWTSPIYTVNAGSFDILQWNERLGSTGSLTFDVMSCDDAACSGESFTTGFSDPNSSDLSSIVANDFFQMRANLSTSDIDFTPTLFLDDGFVIKVFYSKIGATKEEAFTTLYDSGWKDFTPQGQYKWLRRIKVFYRGTAGTISIRYFEEEGIVDNTFEIDLTISADTDIEDDYTGVNSTKIFTYYPPSNEEGLDPVSQLWRFQAFDTSTDDWSIEKIEVKYWLQEPIE